MTDTTTPVDFSGVWALERSENFENYMDALAKNESFMVRQSMKLAKFTKPVQTIQQEGNHFKIETKISSFWTGNSEFTVGEEYINEERGHKMKCLARWENSKLITSFEPFEDSGKAHKQTIVREIEDGLMVMTLILTEEELTCKRFYRRVES